MEANAAFHAKFAFSMPLICDVDRSVTKAFECCKPSETDPCAKSARVCVLVDADGNVAQYLSPFDAKAGPKALLDSL